MKLNYVLKSRLYREEILRWALIIVLSLWAVTATAAFFRSKEKIILIGVSDEMTYLIESSNQKLEAKEKVVFLKHFLKTYFNFDQSTYSEQMAKAGDLMSEDLWAMKTPEILKIRKNLESNPFSQAIQIQSIDELGDGKIEVKASMTVVRKLASQSVNLKISLRLGKRSRNATSPWAYEVQELTDETL